MTVSKQSATTKDMKQQIMKQPGKTHTSSDPGCNASVEDEKPPQVAMVMAEEGNPMGGSRRRLGASRHFYNNNDMFRVFEAITKGEQVFIGNSSVSQKLNFRSLVKQGRD
nr:uncharacterized protein LOC109192636 [Ipomoea batatas]